MMYFSCYSSSSGEELSLHGRPLRLNFEEFESKPNCYSVFMEYPVCPHLSSQMGWGGGSGAPSQGYPGLAGESGLLPRTK